LGKADIDTFRVLIPPDPLLRSFAWLADPLDSRIVATARESRTLAVLRDSLLPKLISGDLRLKDVDRIVAASA
jgi:type I restriction enzyme S subunit